MLLIVVNNPIFLIGTAHPISVLQASKKIFPEKTKSNIFKFSVAIIKEFYPFSYNTNAIYEVLLQSYIIFKILPNLLIRLKKSIRR